MDAYALTVEKKIKEKKRKIGNACKFQKMHVHKLFCGFYAQKNSDSLLILKPVAYILLRPSIIHFRKH